MPEKYRGLCAYVVFSLMTDFNQPKFAFVTKLDKKRCGLREQFNFYPYFQKTSAEIGKAREYERINTRSGKKFVQKSIFWSVSFNPSGNTQEYAKFGRSHCLIFSHRWGMKHLRLGEPWPCRNTGKIQEALSTCIFFSLCGFYSF